MKKRLLILLLLAAGTWAAVHYWPAVKMVVIDPNWPTIDFANVKRMEFKNLHGVFTAVRQDGRFVIQHNGFEYKALDEKLEDVITYINNYTPKRRLEDIPRDKLDSFSLDNATIRFTVDTGEDTWTLSLGEQNPQKTGYYAINSRSEDILIIPTGFNEKIGRKFDLFTNKRMLEFDQQKVVEIHVLGPGVENFVLGKRNGEYVFLAPDTLQQVELDQSKAAEFVKDVATSIGNKFLEDGAEEMPPLNARFEVLLQGEEKPLTITISDSKGDADPIGESSFQPVPYTIIKRNLGRIYIDPMSLKSKAVVHLDTSRISQMKFLRETSEAKKILNVVRSGGDWLEKGSNKPVTGVNILLWKLSELKYVAEPSPEAQESAELAFTWEMADAEGKPVTVVHFYTDPAFPEGQIWFQEQGTSQFFPVEAQILRELETLL